MSRMHLMSLALGLLLCTVDALASECDSPQADWILCEDFEQGALGVDGWYAQSPFVECLGCGSSGRIQMTNDPSRVYDGQWALHMPAAASAGYRGGSLTFRTCQGEQRAGCDPLVGYEQLYFRAWVKLAADHRYVHHFMALAGTRPHGYWDSDGNAGCRPNGQRAAGSTVDFKWKESRGEHEMFFYTYYPEMNCDGPSAGGGYCGDMQPNLCNQCAAKDMPCSDGPECCWGNHFSSDPRPVLPRDRWVCLEMMMRLNTPGQADGEMAFWVDDVLGHRQTGMHWRDVADLQLNKVWVQHYIAAGDASQSNAITWDNVVASTSRIGCGGGPLPDAGAGRDRARAPDASSASDSATAHDAAPAGTDAARADVSSLVDSTSDGCTLHCVDERILLSCDAEGRPVQLTCPPDQPCREGRCQAAAEAATSDTPTSADACHCAGHDATPSLLALWTMAVLGIFRRR